MAAAPQPDPLRYDIRVLPVGFFFVLSHSRSCPLPSLLSVRQSSESLSFELSARLVLGCLSVNHRHLSSLYSQSFFFCSTSLRRS